MKSPYDLFMNIERVKNTIDYIDQKLEKITQQSGFNIGLPIGIKIPVPPNKGELQFIKSLYKLGWDDYYWRIEDDYDTSTNLDVCWLKFYWSVREIEK